MTATSFILRGLWFFRSSYLGVLAGAALGAMVLLGALLAGDSVKQSLRQVAAARLGMTDAVLSGGERMFRSALADEVAAESLMAAPVLVVNATVSVPRNGRMLGNVRVLGVDQRFWQFSPGGPTTPPHDRGMFANDHLARSLGLASNEPLVLRFEKPGPITRDAPLAGTPAELVSLRGELSAVCGDGQFGRFSLENTQLPQATVWVPIERLQQALQLAGMANLLLLRDDHKRDHDALLRAVALHCTLEDYGLTVEHLPLAKALEIRTSRIFFDRQVAAVIQQRFPTAQPVITYLANTLTANNKSTPYSMVTAVGAEAAPFLAGKPDGAVLNAWLAADLGAKPGDELRLDYYALDDGGRLIERRAHLPVTGVVPLSGLAADPRWMPDFPGVAAAENAVDWDPGVPIDVKRIRPKDEAYWDALRGTPKLFLPLAKGREWFGNRWGEFTALRVPAAATPKQAVAKELLDAMTPEVAGLALRDVGRQGLAAAASPVDFAGLLLGMSLFLMAAAVALTAMLFRFHIEQRNRESGLLDALGIPAGKILRWHLLEGLCVVVAGSALGAMLALAYTRFLLGWLESIWAVPGAARMFRFHAGPATVLTGIAGFTSLMMAVIWQVARKQARRGASLRLEAGAEEVARRPAPPVPRWAVGWAAAGTGALAASGVLGKPGAFFLAGCAFLLAGLAAYRWVLQRRAAAGGGGMTPARLAVLNCARRPTRSLVVVGTLASGVFLVVAVAAFRKHGGDEWRQRGSGAGGFAYWVETTTPPRRGGAPTAPLDRLDLGAARSQFGLVLPIRIGAGDDVSCFNLNSVAQPRMLATDAATLARLGAFPIHQTIPGCPKNWNTLRGGEVMRAFVDESTMLWVLKKKVGERLIYQDEWGRPYPVEIAGTLDASIFQGCLVVDESRFLQHHPSADAPRLFLIEHDGDPESGRAVLQQSLVDQGAMVTTTRARLAAFHAVENTYLAIFHVLGGLGVIVGSAGLGLVTARNLADRRCEFAILHTVGVPTKVTRRIVMLESAQLIRWGLGIGSAAAMVAIAPTLVVAGFGQSLAWITLLVGLSGANAWAWSWLGYHQQIRTTLPARQDFS